jgi:hypothetical protein
MSTLCQLLGGSSGECRLSGGFLDELGDAAEFLKNAAELGFEFTPLADARDCGGGGALGCNALIPLLKPLRIIDKLNDARKAVSIAEDGLEHSFDRHAKQWFGRDVSKSTHLGRWKELIERGAKSQEIVPWSTGDTLTYAHVNRIDGKWFVVQSSRVTGELVTAFVPSNAQLTVMLKLLGK